MRAALGGYFDSFGPVEIAPGGLTIQTCCFDDDDRRLLVGLTNNELFADWQGTVRARIGEVASARELWPGRDLSAGDGIELTVPAGEVVILDVRLR